jgi:hypothetical protein
MIRGPLEQDKVMVVLLITWLGTVAVSYEK